MRIAQMLALAVLLGSIPIRNCVSRLVNRSVDELKGGWLGFAWVIEAAIGFVAVYLAKGNLDSKWLVALSGALLLLSGAFPYWLMFKPQRLSLPAALGTLAAISPAAGACTLGVFLLALALPRRRWAPVIAGVTVPISLRLAGANTAFIWYGLALCGCVLMIGFLETPGATVDDREGSR